MKIIHDNEDNNLAECNLLYDILNPSKNSKNTNSNFYPTLQGCMNTRRVRSKYNLFEYC